MNNKGMTLVELIVTFALVLVVVVGLYNLILEIKLQLEEKQVIKDVTEYSATVNNNIHYDILKNEPFAAMVSLSGAGWLSMGSGITDTKVEYSGHSVNIDKEQLKTSECNSLFPCAIYFYVSGESIQHKAISISNGKGTLKEFGITYEQNNEKIFEEVPDQNYLNTDDMKTKSSINIDTTNNMLIINFPIYIKDNKTNYGFKIAYPLS